MFSPTPQKTFYPQKFTCSGRIFRVAVFLFDRLIPGALSEPSLFYFFVIVGDSEWRSLFGVEKITWKFVLADKVHLLGLELEI